MKTSFSIFRLVLLATFLGCAANLQRPSIQEQPLAPGDRLRVSYSTNSGVGWKIISGGGSSKRIVAPLVALDADTLVLENQVAIPLASVTKVEVSRDKKSNGLIGAGIGALVGAGTGAVIGFSDGDEPPLFSGGEPFLFSAEDKAVLGALGGGVIGAIIGALIGANIKSDRWEEVPLEKVRMSNLR